MNKVQNDIMTIACFLALFFFIWIPVYFGLKHEWEMVISYFALFTILVFSFIGFSK